jgi:plastocyanin
MKEVRPGDVVLSYCDTYIKAAGMSACGGYGSEADPVGNESSCQHKTGAETLFDIANFTILNLMVKPGTTVTWTNRDGAPHTTTSGAAGAVDGTWDSDRLSTGDAFSFTFEFERTFPYFCAVHPSSMSGVITVTQSADSYGLIESSGSAPGADTGLDY